MAYQITWTKKGLILELTGEVNRIEITKAYKDANNDESFDQLKFHIIDLSKATSTLYNFDDIEQLAFLSAASAKSNADIHEAIIVPPNNEMRTMAKHYEIANINEAWSTKVFYELEAAKEWLSEKKLFSEDAI